MLDGRQLVAEQRKTRKSSFAGVTKAAPLYRTTFQLLRLDWTLLGSRFP
jgi:hypothetical protein